MYQKKSGAETAEGCNAALIFIHLVLEKRCSFVNHEKNLSRSSLSSSGKSDEHHFWGQILKLYQTSFNCFNVGTIVTVIGFTLKLLIERTSCM